MRRFPSVSSLVLTNTLHMRQCPSIASVILTSTPHMCQCLNVSSLWPTKLILVDVASGCTLPKSRKLTLIETNTNRRREGLQHCQIKRYTCASVQMCRADVSTVIRTIIDVRARSTDSRVVPPDTIQMHHRPSVTGQTPQVSYSLVRYMYASLRTS